MKPLNVNSNEGWIQIVDACERAVGMSQRVLTTEITMIILSYVERHVVHVQLLERGGLIDWRYSVSLLLPLLMR